MNCKGLVQTECNPPHCKWINNCVGGQIEIILGSPI